MEDIAQRIETVIVQLDRLLGWVAAGSASATIPAIPVSVARVQRSSVGIRAELRNRVDAACGDVQPACAITTSRQRRRHRLDARAHTARALDCCSRSTLETLTAQRGVQAVYRFRILALRDPLLHAMRAGERDNRGDDRV